MNIPGLSLPGLGSLPPPSTNSAAYPSHDPSASTAPQPRTLTLAANAELRLELSTSTPSITLKLLPSYPSTLTPSTSVPPAAEIFGTDLAPNHVYTIPSGSKLAVLSPTGCALELTGTPDSEYTSDETTAVEAANLAFALDAHSTQRGEGARVLLLGAADSGKTSLAKTLVGYSLRLGRSPMVVNLDPSEGVLALPGSLSAAVFGAGAILDVEDVATGGWGTSAVAGAAGVPVKSPLVYHFGRARAEDHPVVFKAVTTRMAVAATGRYEEDAAAKRGGMVLQLGASCVGAGAAGGYDLVSHVVSEFSVNVVVVLGSEKLYNDMARRHEGGRGSDEAVAVVKLARSGGCVERDDAFRKSMAELAVRNYFFGSAANPLSPHTTTVDFAALTVLQFVGAGAAGAGPASRFAPGGAEDDGEDDDYEPPDFAADAAGRDRAPIYRKVQPSISMDNALMVLKYASVEDAPATIRDAPVMGYLFFADVDEAKRKVKILSPVGGRLPLGSPLCWGEWPAVKGDFQV